MNFHEYPVFYIHTYVIIFLACGVVAHLGERIAGSDEVERSSLFSSTIDRRQD